MQRIKYSKDEIEGRELEVQETLTALDAPGSFHSGCHENISAGGGDPHPLAPARPHHNTATTLTSKNAWERLIKREFAPHEPPFLIEAIFASKDTSIRDTIHRLLKDDARIFVDVIDETLDRPNLSPWTKKKCIKLLYRTCGRHALLPKSLKISVAYDRTGAALKRGGFADVWKGEYCGRDVAVKVIRTYSDSDLQKVICRFYKEVAIWKTLQHPNVLPLIRVTASENQLAMISDWMVNGNINEFVRAHPDANRLELLGDAATGLIYIHNQGMVHGDLKGANVLIDQTGHARLADFGLLTIISDPAIFLSSSSCIQGGTVRWMGPELLAPQDFGLKNGRPTKSSDCYSLGMVVYETINGDIPFHEDTDLMVFVKVLRGEHPSRGAKFTKRLWEMMERCWTWQPNNRPCINDVLRCLEMPLDPSEPFSLGAGEGMEMDGNDSDSASSGFGLADVNSLGPEVTNLDLRIGSNDEGTHQGLLSMPELIGTAKRPYFGVGILDLYQFSSIQGSPQPLEGGPVPAATVTEASKRRGKKSANFVCPIPECRSAFNKREELKGHIYSHSGEKAFKCMWPGCGKGFTRNNTLIRHETVHFGHIPLVCEGCGKSFTRKDNLRQHLRSSKGRDCQKAQGAQKTGFGILTV